MKNQFTFVQGLHTAALFCTTFIGCAVQNPLVTISMVVVSILLVASLVNQPAK